MKKTTYTLDKAPDFVPTVNTSPTDYNLLINKPESSSTGGAYAVFDFWATAGATGDGTYRIVNLQGTNGDMQVPYTSITLLDGLGTMDYKLTKVVNGISVTGNDITVPAGKVCRVQMFMSSSSHNGRITITGGSVRYLQGGNTDFSTTNSTLTFINASASDLTFTIKYGTSASNRPIFGVSIEIF